MGCIVRIFKLGFFSALLAGFVAVGIGYWYQQSIKPLNMPETGYWGPALIKKGTTPPGDDEAIYNYKVSFDDKLVTSLKQELARTKWVEPLEDARYHYGVNPNSFRKIIEYWQNQYDFKKAEAAINSYPHYQTQIEGIKIHFFRSAPTKTDNKTKIIPLLLIHGWPGSFVEFLKIAGQLSKPVDEIAFDVIVPSIPGYGYSEPSRKQGMNVLTTARIFKKLMSRIGYSKYYAQGGDWGAAIVNAMGVLYPDSLRGLHVNIVFQNYQNPWTLLKLIAFTWFPNIVGDGELPFCMPIPFSRFFFRLIRESGYFHIQSTKPDTIGFALLNSPAGLAAYILEKFSTWTSDKFRLLEDGGLTNKFTIDELLTNVMVYYSSGSIVSSQRYYKENVSSHLTRQLFKQSVRIPAGYSVFPHDLVCAPRALVMDTYTNLTMVNYHKDGGHFAAYELPNALEADIRKFVQGVEETYPEEIHASKGFRAI
ncbi:epoxide hydrolase 1-like [Varroa destructor]|uniref:Epoxide hydrolase n=1 Tax=Varroa destructor TaxID=109461 RepID=A0A7M7KLD7_VARDE|nr:epoxide hydrolase 1-like [Varroa destructor]XP_022668682.1 epoxide hydrolase 1-like [Varroa destructor]